jgi:hypothetical protein
MGLLLIKLAEVLLFYTGADTRLAPRAHSLVLSDPAASFSKFRISEM